MWNVCKQVSRKVEYKISQKKIYKDYKSYIFQDVKKVNKYKWKRTYLHTNCSSTGSSTEMYLLHYNFDDAPM